MSTELFSRGAVPRAALAAAALSVTLVALTGCVGVGIGVPIAPGVSLGVGYGAGGPSVGLGTGWGPVGVGVGVNGSGQVIGSGGLGASAGPVSVGVGRSVVLSDPAAPSYDDATTAAQTNALDGSGVPLECGVVVGAQSVASAESTHAPRSCAANDN